MQRVPIVILATFVGFLTWGQAQEEKQKVTIKKAGDALRVEIDGELFTEYKYEGLPNPILYPIIGPGGVEMMRHYPMKKGVANEADDHPHHKSLWYTHGDVNGVDFWHKEGKVVMDSIENTESKGDHAGLKAKNRWIAIESGKEILADTRDIVFGVNEDGSRYIDYSITFKATQGDVTFGDTKEGSMAIRTHPELRVKGDVATGKARNDSGDRDKLLWGKEAKWVHYWGTVGSKPVGLAIMDHPKNPRHPTTWHARDYGLIAANPFGWKHFFKGEKGSGDFKIEAGKSATFRYRFLFHAGGEKEGKVEEAYEAFAKS